MVVVFSLVLKFPRYILVLLIVLFYFLYADFFQQLVSEPFGLIHGGWSSVVKFRLEKIGGRIMFGMWKIKSRMR
jgi:hypothetical protein